MAAGSGSAGEVDRRVVAVAEREAVVRRAGTESADYRAVVVDPDSSVGEGRARFDAPVVTLINVFTVDPSKQDELVKVLDNATEKVIKSLTGFVSANIHRSFDGRHVANYAQWESREALDARASSSAAAFARRRGACAV